ncbi:MAG: hypothetical protein BAA01_09545 [Bacillus thermozeamaize]|uniref:Recombinase domain-containing protein n=1 Tax=Bacillus thermozeamaize TaxID=230954 RepID=A0A1Y3PEE2_9BACI|nr:MAG: hypothetical protein BAA01_09545 [Bacillus thermozeamaize]
MDKIPFGYTLKDGKFVVDENEATIVRLMHELYVRGCNEEDIRFIFNKFGIPKRGQEWKRPLEEIRDDIFKLADELIQERLEEREKSGWKAPNE